MYVDSNVGISQTNADARYYLNTTTLDTITAPVLNVSLNGNKITSLGTPTLDTDAVTKLYVDQNVGISQTNADGRYYRNDVTLDSIT